MLTYMQQYFNNLVNSYGDHDRSVLALKAFNEYVINIISLDNLDFNDENMSDDEAAYRSRAFLEYYKDENTVAALAYDIINSDLETSYLWPDYWYYVDLYKYSAVSPLATNQLKE